jgi:hypothetical protein
MRLNIPEEGEGWGGSTGGPTAPGKPLVLQTRFCRSYSVFPCLSLTAPYKRTPSDVGEFVIAFGFVFSGTSSSVTAGISFRTSLCSESSVAYPQTATIRVGSLGEVPDDRVPLR